MADTKISVLDELTSLATGDLSIWVDVSDTTMAASGTNKKVTLADVAAAVLASPTTTGPTTIGTLTGLLKGTTGVVSAATAGTDYLAPAAIGVTVQAYDADLGVIAGLADPDADRILFWDDSAGSYAYLTAGSGLTITGTSIAASGGGGSAPFTSDASNPIARDASDATKLLALDVSAVATATTRTFSVPDASGRLAVSASALTSGRVPVATTGGLLTNFSTLTADTSGNLTATAYYFSGTAAAIEPASFHGLTIRAPYTDGTQAQLNVWDDGLYATGRVDAATMALHGRDSHTFPMFSLMLPSAAATMRNAGGVDALLATTTDASWKGRVTVYAGDFSSSHAGRREGVRVESDGTQALLGFYGGTAAAKPTVTGSKGGNAALGSLLTALAGLGLLTDSSS